MEIEASTRRMETKKTARETAGGPVRVHIFLFGRVQGVLFRAFIKDHATKLGVYGWVRNMADGRVEIVAESEKNRLKRLIGLVRKGPLLARIEKVKVSWEKATRKFQNFSIEV